jgi:phosphoserine phosphatase
MFPELMEAHEKDWNDFCKRIRENGLVVSDSDDLYWHPLLPIARDLGMETEYRDFIGNGGACYEAIAKQMTLLKGYPVDRGAEKMREAQLFPGSKESIEAFKKHGLEVVIITDNPLAQVMQNKDIFRDKMGVNHILSTSTAEIREGKYTGGLSSFTSKPEIVDYWVEKYKPKKLIGIIQGENDIHLGKAVKKHGGYVFVVNSNSPEMSEMADTHIEKIEQAPEIIEKVLKELMA